MKNNYEINSIIHDIDKSKDNISDIWLELNNQNFQKIEEIWKDDITQEYIDKFKKTDDIVKCIIDNLENLKKEIVKNQQISEERMIEENE